MNNTYKNKVFYSFDIIVKAGTLNFYCRYLCIKSLVVSASDTTNMGLTIVQNLGTEARQSSQSCTSWMFQESQIGL